MTSEEAKPELVLGRLREARESLQDAELLLAQGGSMRGVINRAYYAVFYAIQALMECRHIKTRKHGGAMAMFDLHFVRAGVFSTEMSEIAHEALAARLENDYRLLVPSSREETRRVLDRGRVFVTSVHEWLSNQDALQ